ncbi:MAG: hypothetical protein JWM09_808 [Francisellaceae bacterium]|nr:hypothetical protein [Francisellaceae bacterium]
MIFLSKVFGIIYIGQSTMKFKFLHKLSVVIYLLLHLNAVCAAGPITHVLLAEMWANNYEKFNKQEYDSFIRGTLFPDIHYLNVI